MATLAGFLSFIRNNMQISDVFLPDDSVAIDDAFTISVETVSLTIQQVSPKMYDIAVYNLAGDILINYADDQAPYTFFKDLRAKFDCNGFVSGVVTSSSDSGTSQSLQTPSSLSELTLSDLQRLKTKYGRTYLEIAQRYTTSWGMS